MPVALFVFAGALLSAVSIVLNAKPERKDAAITKMTNDVFFILCERFVIWYVILTFTVNIQCLAIGNLR